MKLLGTKEVSERLGVSQQQVQKLIKIGRLPAQFVGRDYIIRESDLRLISVRKVGRPKKKAT